MAKKLTDEELKSLKSWVDKQVKEEETKTTIVNSIIEAVGGCSTYWASVIAERLIADDITCVVRCKKCTYFSEANEEFNYPHCTNDHWYDSTGWASEVSPDGYCNYSERKCEDV